MEDFTKALFNTPSDADKITAVFKDGTQAEYTRAIIDLLKNDPFIVDIYDSTTGEIL